MVKIFYGFSHFIRRHKKRLNFSYCLRTYEFFFLKKYHCIILDALFWYFALIIRRFYLVIHSCFYPEKYHGSIMVGVESIIVWTWNLKNDGIFLGAFQQIMA